MSIWTDTRGGTAIIWAVSVLPLLVCAGAAMDFSQNRAQSAEVQAAIDHTALAVARFALDNEDVSDADLDAFAQRYFESNSLEISGYTIGSVDVNRADNRFDVEVGGHGPTSLLALAGINQLPISAAAAAELSPEQSPLEIALVLDSSDSMSGSRMDTLQSAATNMINTLVVEDGHVKMAIVPFNLGVNVGEGMRGASWLDINDERSESVNSCSTDADASRAAGCSQNSCGGRNSETGNCYSTWSCPSGVNLVQTCSPRTAEYVWEGCVRSRSAPLNAADSSFGSDPVPSWSLENTSICPNSNRVRPLTDEPGVLIDAVDGMRATWRTYIPAGLTWGRRVLSQAEPFTESQFADADDIDMGNGRSAKSIVLMSDGANTGSLNSDLTHWGSDIGAANTLTASLCEDIKTAGIELFVVAFEVTDPDTRDLLEECASLDVNYFEANSELQLSASFAEIAQEFSRRRDLALVQ